MKAQAPRLRTLFIYGLILGLTACAGGPSVQQAKDDFATKQMAAAQTATSNGDLAMALRLWQTLLPLPSARGAASNAIETLESEIATQVGPAIEKGEAAYARGDQRLGDRWMLEVLALQPGNPRALKALRKSVSEASHARQAEKIASEYEGLAKKEEDEAAAEAAQAAAYLASVQRLFAEKNFTAVIAAAREAPAGVAAEVGSVEHDAHLALAVEAYRAGDKTRQLAHIEDSLPTAGSQRESLRKQALRLRGELSEEDYKKGLGLMKSNLDGAIRALERAVNLRPDNIAATEKLDQAKTLRKNLKKIQSN